MEVNSSEIENCHSLKTILQQSQQSLCCYCLEVKELSYGLCASCLDKISYNNISDQDNSDNEEETKADPPSPEVSSYSYTIDSETPSTIPDSLETARSIANQSSE